jgi:SET domain-containing protein
MSRFRGLPPYRVRRSAIHGTGVFATRPIRAGTRIVEYRGERVSHAQADRRYADRDPADNHTFLFTLDAHTVIDGGVGGSAARFINHGCEPNCEALIVRGRVFIEALADIRTGEELVYDYRLERDPDDPPGIEATFGCRCRVWECRGTMLLPLRVTARRALVAHS